MEEELKKDIVDGKIVDWRKLSIDELKKMKVQLKQKEQNILRKIDEELNKDEDEISL